MTNQREILEKTHLNAQQLIASELQWRGCLCSNNHNLQMLIYYEAFRQTAYTMISDGGCNLAIEMMEMVIDEMRKVKKAKRDKSFDETSFRDAQDRKRNLEDWGIFMDDIPYDGEVPYEDEEDECDDA